MNFGNQAIGTPQTGTRASDAESDRDGSAAFFTGYSSKRDRQLFPLTNSPAKRTKLSGSNWTNASHDGRKDQGLLTGSPTEPSGARAAHSSEHSRKNYLGNSGKGNNLSGMRFTGGIDSVAEATVERLTISDHDAPAVSERDARLSRTPPPFSIELEDANESPLPPTIRQRNRSPDTVKRGLEEIYSSGKRKLHHGRIDHASTPDGSPTRKPRSNTPGDPTDNYYAAASMRTKGKGYQMFFEYHEALQREIKLLEDELAVEKRKAQSIRGANTEISTPNEISSFITQCLDINNEGINCDVVTTSHSFGELETDIRRKLSPGDISSQRGMKDLSTLTFTEYNTAIQGPNSVIRSQRCLQGYSHENLLHFKATMEVLPTTSPVIHSLKIEYSDWARIELGKALSKLSTEQNVSIALYSIASYAALAKKRAECWVVLQSRFSRLIPAVLQPEAILKAQSHRASEDGPGVGRRFLVANLPRRKMTFRGRNALSNAHTSSEAEVCLSWSIDIAATGEGFSDVSAHIKLLPDDADGARVTQQMSNLFRALVGEYGFMEGASRLLETFFGNS
ncbi:hypothetical protein TWF730_010777 [Orbilia blumenaviensis]|uniref:Uncharacterized protein n=1 Tax=Orbilia blumenaviensis TaxID=1796055 RepID=A0AAV9UT02_9PEZI